MLKFVLIVVRDLRISYEKKIFLIGIVVLIICIGLCGCSSDLSNVNSNNLEEIKSKFIGTWQENVANGI